VSAVTSQDRLARVALTRLSEPGDVRLADLVGRLGPAEVFKLLQNQQDVTGLYTDVATRLRGLDPAHDLETARKRGIRFICPGDPEWPAQVDGLDGAGQVLGRGGSPLGLWVRGPLDLATATGRSVAIVGSRSATTYGASVASEVAAHVAADGFTVVSGAAFGIDQAAHRGALATQGATVAVLACGVDRAYPSAHRNLLDYIAETGLIVSELPPGCAPTKLRFLSRNRLIAALSGGTLVVEAAVRSGALSTANWAARLNRVLMGVPGPVTSAPSEGVHELLRSHAAELVTRGEHVLELLSPSGTHLAEEPHAPERAEDRLTPRERQVLDAVPAVQPASCGSIARTAGVSEAEVQRCTERLSSRGLVERGGFGWRRSAPA
jgi:DNA processing protein